MADGVDGGDLERGEEALQSGRWTEARDMFDSVLTSQNSAEANLGLAAMPAALRRCADGEWEVAGG